MIFTGLHHTQYITGRELGKGGEGVVYDLQNHSNLVLKSYNEPLGAEKVSKLRQMIAARTEAIEAYAAWPVDLAIDEDGVIGGFVMKKLSGFVPLHTAFSPMDRKKLFRDKGYNFLVHVARNLATAFFKLHEAGLIVGDVNEGNILINASGIVSLIDCDSFQVKGIDTFYFCEVGVPRYTPPELLKKGSFDNVVRTENTDSFSLAILIFQLLFMGRHPFAGRNKLTSDFDEATAIRQHQFAYSLENTKKKLAPPKDSFEITNLPGDIVAFFHRAFEQDQRPLPAEWIKALDAMLADMATCFASKLHTYPSKLKECPWCFYKNNSGILYFLDDSYLHATATFSDIESFVNGFNVEKLELKKWNGNLAHPELQPTPIARQFYRYKSIRGWVGLSLLFLWIIFCMVCAINMSYVLIAIWVPMAIRRYSPWTKKIKEELEQRIKTQQLLKQKLTSLIAEYDYPANTTNYSNNLNMLNKLVNDFRKLPDEYERQKKVMEERIYNEQLNNFLSRYEIEAHNISSFGVVKKSLLFNNGIYNAADIAKLQKVRLPGIGPKNLQVLLDWQRQIASTFLYIPDDDKITLALGQVNQDMASLRLKLESAIRKEYQSLSYQKENIANRGLFLAKQIRELSVKTYQAEIDLMMFRKFAA